MEEYQHRSKQELIRELAQLKTRMAQATSGKEYLIEESDLRSYLPEGVGEEIFLMTETGRIVFANEIMLGSLGREREEVVGKSLADFDLNFRRSTWLSTVTAMKRTGKSIMFESRQQTAESAVRTIDVAASYIQHRGKNFVLCVGSEREKSFVEEAPTTDNAAAGSGISAGTSREQAILATVQDGILIVDAKAVIVDANAAGCRVLGLPKSEIIGRSCVDPKWRYIDAGGNIMKLSEHPVMVALVEEEPVLNTRVSMLQLDGGLQPFLLSVMPLFDQSRNVTGAVASFRSPQPTPETRDLVRSSPRGAHLHAELLRTLMESDTVHALERQICELVRSLESYSLVWTGTIRHNDPKIHVSTSVGDAKDYLLKIRMRYDDSDQGRGSAGECIRLRMFQVTQDIEEDDRYVLWKKQAVKMRLFSSAYFPVPLPAGNIMLLGVYSNERGHFTPERVERLTVIAGALAHGMATLIFNGERDELAQRTAIHERLTEVLQSETGTAIALFDAASPHLTRYANTAFCSLLDEPFRSAGVLGQPLQDFAYCHQHQSLFEQVQQCARDGKAMIRRSDTFRDWEGNESSWKWQLLPCGADDGTGQVLYIGNKLDGVPRHHGHDQAAETMPEAASHPDESESPSDADIRIGITMPRPKPRSRKQTRISRFYDEGVVFEASTAAQEYFGVREPANGYPSPLQLFSSDQTLQNGIEEAVATAEGTSEFPVPSTAPDTDPRQCEVRVEHVDDDTSRVWITLR